MDDKIFYEKIISTKEELLSYLESYIEDYYQDRYRETICFWSESRITFLNLEKNTLEIKNIQYLTLDYEEELFPGIKSTISYETRIITLKYGAFANLANTNTGAGSVEIDFDKTTFEDCGFLNKPITVNLGKVSIEAESFDNTGVGWDDPELPKEIIDSITGEFDYSNLILHLREGFIMDEESYIEKFNEMNNRDDDECVSSEEYGELMIKYYLSDRDIFPKALHDTIRNVIREKAGDFTD